MPSIEIPWILTIINEKNLEQAGIIANFFAGLFLAVEYFVSSEKIDQLNSRLDYRTAKVFSRSSTAAKALLKFNRKVLLVIIISIILISVFQVALYHQSTLVVSRQY